MSPINMKLWRDLGRHRAQFIAVAVTIFLGVAMFAASYDSYSNLDASYAATFSEYRFANLTLVGGDAGALESAIIGQAGVESTEVRTTADVPFHVDEIKLLGRMVGIPGDRESTVNQLDLVSGSTLAVSGTDEVLVEEHMANHFGLEAGDTFSVLAGDRWVEVSVAGVVISPEYIWPARSRNEIITTPDNFGVVFADQEWLTQIAGPANEVAVYFADGDGNEALEADLLDTGSQYGALTAYSRDEQASNAALSEDIKGFEEIAVFFPLMFLSAAAMAAYVMISRMVHAQRPLIGVLLANGVSRRQVLRHYLGFGLVPGLLAALPGVVVGMLLARTITKAYTSILSIPVTVVEFYPATLVIGVAFGLVAAVTASLAPALVASRIQPASAMRGESQIRVTKSSVFERFVPPVRGLPLRWRMALRGIERSPRRTFYTVLGVVLSLMLVLVSWGMIDTVQHLFAQQFDEIEREDATVYFARPIGSEEVASFAAAPEVDRIEPMIQLPVSIKSDTATFDTALVSLGIDTQLHRFRDAEGGWTHLPDMGLLLGVAARDELGIETGDEVTVVVPLAGTEITETVAGFVDEPLGTLAYISTERLNELAGYEIPATAALVAYAEGTDGVSARAALTELPAVAAFDDAEAMRQMMTDFMSLFYLFVGVMLLFGSAMAFALIFNSMSVNIAERKREVATLLAVGMERKTISRLITAENLLVAVIGIPFGLVVGYYGSKMAMKSFESDMFAFDLYIKPVTYFIASAAILVVALISQWPGLRAIRKLSISTIVKERSA